MVLLATILTAVSALEHAYFFVLESILWKTPFGLKTFQMDAAKAEITSSLATNQGVYNLFLAAGLLWGTISAPPFLLPVRGFFLGCVVIAAIVGGVTVSKRILFIQGLPALLAMGALALS